MTNNVVNRMSSWAQYLSRDPADEDAIRIAEDIIKLLDVTRTANEFLMKIDTESEERTALITSLKAVAEHRVEIIRPESSGIIIT